MNCMTLMIAAVPLPLSKDDGNKGAGSRQNESNDMKTNKMICAPSKDSGQPGHPPCLI